MTRTTGSSASYLRRKRPPNPPEPKGVPDSGGERSQQDEEKEDAEAWARAQQVQSVDTNKPAKPRSN